jgi:hypothetical protein
MYPFSYVCAWLPARSPFICATSIFDKEPIPTCLGQKLYVVVCAAVVLYLMKVPADTSSLQVYVYKCLTVISRLGILLSTST